MVAILPHQDNRRPAMAAAFVLHIGVFVMLTLLAPSPPLALGGAVPINIVSDAPTTVSAPALQAPREQAPATATPADRGNPIPATAVAPPQPPRVAVTPPAKSTPSPQTARTAPHAPQQRPAFSLDALAASVAQATAAEHARAGRAPAGAPRPRTAREVRVDAGQGVSQSDMQGLQQLLERLWNPTCSVDGAGAVVVPVRFSVGDDGRLTTRAVATGSGVSANPVVFAAARRAIDAVHQAEPYAAAYRGKSFTVIFDAQKACAER